MTLVQILLGSESDESTVSESKMAETLRDVGVNYEVHVYSAHRNPDELTKFCRKQAADGCQVFIGVAGMAAALPGAIAGITNSSAVVIGVPLDEHGIDSCLYMPPGVPVLLTGVGKAGLRNASLAACQILAIGDAEVRQGLNVWLASHSKAPKNNIEL